MKKVLSLLLILILVAGVTSVPAFAEEIGTLEDKASLSLSVGEGDVYPGGTVEITVAVADNPGLAGVKFELDYDTDVFTLRGAKSAEIPNGSECLVDGFLEIGPDGVIWANGENLEENTGLIKLIFDVSASAALGDYTIGFAADSASGGHATETDGVKHELYVDVNLGDAATVTVTERKYILGDADGSGTVDISDVPTLFYLIAYGENVPVAVGDVDGSGSVDVSDVPTLFYMIAYGAI